MTESVGNDLGSDPDAAGRRIGELYDELAASLPASAWAAVAELTRLLTSIHGAGLARVMERARTLPDADELVAALVDDPLISSLLLVYDLHPADEPNPAEPPAQPVRLISRGSRR